jgi:hypothetical protein
VGAGDLAASWWACSGWFFVSGFESFCTCEAVSLASGQHWPCDGAPPPFPAPCSHLWHLFNRSPCCGCACLCNVRQPPEAVLLGHQDRVNCLCLFTDNSTLLSGADDGYMCVWQLPPAAPAPSALSAPASTSGPGFPRGATQHHPHPRTCALSPRHAVFIGSKVGTGVAPTHPMDGPTPAHWNGCVMVTLQNHAPPPPPPSPLAPPPRSPPFVVR